MDSEQSSDQPPALLLLLLVEMHLDQLDDTWKWFIQVPELDFISSRGVSSEAISRNFEGILKGKDFNDFTFGRISNGDILEPHRASFLIGRYLESDDGDSRDRLLQSIPQSTDLMATIEEGETTEDFAKSLLSLVIECRTTIAAAGFDAALEEISKDPRRHEVLT
ncbi:hypothetical protein [Salipiger bermudensis]|uniref:hypothetical protein n=1 Tax=Salipiger bermudensis TaxID=344736 RepID=UPI00118677F5|nr:hypothetical protein [Salipiger bermudensis]